MTLESVAFLIVGVILGALAMRVTHDQRPPQRLLELLDLLDAPDQSWAAVYLCLSAESLGAEPPEEGR